MVERTTDKMTNFIIVGIILSQILLVIRRKFGDGRLSGLTRKTFIQISTRAPPFYSEKRKNGGLYGDSFVYPDSYSLLIGRIFFSTDLLAGGNNSGSEILPKEDKNFFFIKLFLFLFYLPYQIL